LPESAEVEQKLAGYKAPQSAVLEEEGMDLMSRIRATRKQPSVRQSKTQEAAVPKKFPEVKFVDLNIEKELNAIASRKRSQEALAGKASQEAKERQYEEIMDQHALQIFLIRNGQVIEETPEYQSFKRLAGKKWPKVLPFILLLQKYVLKLGVKLIKVNGSKILELILGNKKPTVPNAMSCLLPFDSETLINYYELLRYVLLIEGMFRR
jgi:hypothetical protein